MRFGVKTLFSTVFLLLIAEADARYLWSSPQKPVQSQSRFNYDRTADAQEVSSFFSERKMSFGMGVAGYHGLAGALVGIHFHPDWSTELAFGGGSHFQSYGIRMKRYFLRSSALNPYLGFGFHRWQRTQTRPVGPETISPSYVADHFMSDADRLESRIDERLLHGSLGLQYVFTQGEWAGSALFAELVMLASIQDLRSLPTASFGFNYFF